MSFTIQGDYSAIKVVSVLTKFLKKLEKKFFEQIKIILARLWRNNSQRFSLKSRSGNAIPVCSRRGRGTPPSRFWPRPPPSWPDSYNLSHSVAIVRFLRCHFFERERKKNFFQVKTFIENRNWIYFCLKIIKRLNSLLQILLPLNYFVKKFYLTFMHKISR